MEANFDGKKLREVRKSRDLSQVSLASRAGSSDHYIRDLEMGRKSNPSAQVVCKISYILGVSMDTFMRIEREEGDMFFK